MNTRVAREAQGLDSSNELAEVRRLAMLILRTFVVLILYRCGGSLRVLRAVPPTPCWVRAQPRQTGARCWNTSAAITRTASKTGGALGMRAQPPRAGAGHTSRAPRSCR